MAKNVVCVTHVLKNVVLLQSIAWIANGRIKCHCANGQSCVCLCSISAWDVLYLAVFQLRCINTYVSLANKPNSTIYNINQRQMSPANSLRAILQHTQVSQKVVTLTKLWKNLKTAILNVDARVQGWNQKFNKVNTFVSISLEIIISTLHDTWRFCCF